MTLLHTPLFGRYLLASREVAWAPSNCRHISMFGTLCVQELQLTPLSQPEHSSLTPVHLFPFPTLLFVYSTWSESRRKGAFQLFRASTLPCIQTSTKPSRRALDLLPDATHQSASTLKQRRRQPLGQRAKDCPHQPLACTDNPPYRLHIVTCRLVTYLIRPPGWRLDPDITACGVHCKCSSASSTILYVPHAQPLTPHIAAGALGHADRAG